MESIYIHIPFCRSICSYCDFCKMLYTSKDSTRYLEALKCEVEEYYLGETIKTIYIGGGTPSLLNPEELGRLFKIVRLIKKTVDCEITFECNPDDITEVLIDILKANGVNRISIGVESFNTEKLTFMERKSDFEDIKDKIKLINNKGIYNINLDLMYGIPDEGLDVLKKDLKLILKLNPEHISTYSLIVEDSTKVKIRGDKNIDEDLEADMYNYIVKKLKNKGYIHYEVSNFAKDGYFSKHNLTYWNNKEYYGFGLGASGYINGFRYENTKNIDTYCEGIYRKEEALLSKQEIMEYELMLGLRKTEGINLQDFFDKYEINMQDAFPIKPLLKNKDLIYKQGQIFINPEKRYIMNEILLKLI
ncbi:MAG: radical SAM family heme chaperone HemW [Bacilli bacterium]|nr:radical SAM family heme chaperone HemW [Bacilli bacterium]MDD4795382.1 radical SAM family heme chaperone HemW [Bacilli bacterium]